MSTIPIERLPLLAGVGLGAVVLFVITLPVFRDPAVIEALEAQPSAAWPVAPGEPRSSAGDDGARASTAPSEDGATPSAKPDAPTAGASVSDAELGRATSVTELKALAKRAPKDANVLTKLARAEAGQPDTLADAMGTLKTLFAVSPKSLEDKELVGLVNQASGSAALPAQDAAFELMSNGMGSKGIELLFDLSAGPPAIPAAVKQRALDATKKDDVKKLASPAVRVAIELRDHPGCERKSYLDEVEKSGDKRSVPFLTPYQRTKGCGFFKQSDCYGCFGNRDKLNRAIQAANTR